jgi:hypothetical protein
MERFFDGMDQENSKTQGGKGQIRNFFLKKTRRKEWRKEKKKKFHSWSVLLRDGRTRAVTSPTTY